jgi:glycosyltransferase involved in cell wall biosynthesis
MTEPAPISVIIPAYNSEDFLREAIESVRGQSLPVSEIIVVDDGSTDRTSEIARGLGVKVIRQQNKGVCAARNVGIRAAVNEWIAFIDQDDLWMPEKIESQWLAVGLHPDVGIVSCLMNWFEDESMKRHSTQTLPEVPLPPQEPVDDGSVTYIQRVKKELPLSRMLDYTSSVLVRRDLLLSVGMFNESLRQNEDLECFLRVIAQGPLAIVKKKLVRRRIHTKNVALNDPAGAMTSYHEILGWLREHPQKYPPGAARAYNEVFARALISTGRTLMDEGQMREARTLFARSFEGRWSARPMFLWSISLLGPSVFKSLLAIKRKLF